MRLLRYEKDGTLGLVKRMVNDIPPYAILSHTWGPDNEEPQFGDLIQGTGKNKEGYRKLLFCQEQAARDGLEFCWVDTCCIDKSDHVELTESLNSMFRWYRNAEKCYVYMPDVSTTSPSSKPLRASRWFTRGWTLQELLAPASVEFFSVEGSRLGDKRSLSQELADITGIPTIALEGKDLSEFGIEERMKWAEHRQTGREEDAAYCLLGIFDVFIPVIYGEKKDNALRRLRKAIDEFNEQRGKPGRIYQWLSAPDPSTNHQQALKQRSPGTGAWFIESKRFITWKTDVASRLWLHGIPGCGKTVLSATILQELMQHCQGDTGMTVLYFYFDLRDDKKRDPGTMLRSLASQLSSKSPEPLIRLRASCGSGQYAPGWDDLLEAIQLILPDYKHVYLVLDALGECTHRSDLMTMLEAMLGWQPENLHVLVTSREEREIEECLTAFVTEENSVCLGEDVVGRDIEQYVRRTLSEDKRLSKWTKNPAMRQEIETALINGSRGMFRWAALHLSTLGTHLNRKMLRSALSASPPKLYEMYERILCGINADNSTYALRILRWLVFCARPVSIAEIAYVAAIDVGGDTTGSFDRDEVLEDPMEALNICSSLITAAAADSEAARSDPSHRILSLSHYTVREYLVSATIANSKASRYCLQDTTYQHYLMATSCLQYLVQLNLDQPTASASTSTSPTSPLAAYCAEYWTTHALTCGAICNDNDTSATTVERREHIRALAARLPREQKHNPNPSSSVPPHLDPRPDSVIWTTAGAYIPPPPLRWDSAHR